MRGALVFCLLVSACGPTANANLRRVSAECAAPAIADVAIKILPRVVLALFSNDYSSLLSSVVDTLVGSGIPDAAKAVKCAVEIVDKSLIPSPGTSLQPDAIRISQNAKAYLAGH